MPVPDVDAIVFDAVGTLIMPDPPAAEAYLAAARRHGSRLSLEAIAARFAAAFAREEEDDAAAGLRTSEARELARWRRIVSSVLDDVADVEACFQALFAHFAAAGSWRCHPDVAVLLEGLARRGYVLGLASNFDQRLRSVVDGLPDLKPLTRHVIVSSEVGWRKPAAAFFAALCRDLGRPAPRILYVGDDRRNDFDGARNAGLQARCFDPRGKEDVPPDLRVRSLLELLA